MENVVRIDSAEIDDIWEKYVKNPKELNPRDNIFEFFKLLYPKVVNI